MKTLALVFTAFLFTTATAQTEITFWYAIGGKLGEVVDDLVTKYNTAQDEVIVNAEYTGDYDDTDTKLRAAIRTDSAPNLAHLHRDATRTYTDLAEAVPGAIVPAQVLIDRDELSRDAFLDVVANSYTIGGTLYSVPFNTSTAILYLNADMFRDAGLDPDDPSFTYQELTEAFEKLTVKDAQGNIERYGMTMPFSAGVLELLLYNEGEYYCNNENGRAGRATAVAWDGQASQNIVQWVTDMIRQGYMAYVTSPSDTIAPFLAEQTAAILVSSAFLTSLTEDSEGKFELATAYLPYPEGKERTGVSVGGGSLWILGQHPDAEVKATTDFVKFLLEPEQQVQWHLATGYFPAVEAALALPEVREFHTDNPAYTTAIQQLQTSGVNNVTAGCLVTGNAEISGYLTSAIEDVINGHATAEEALTRAAARANEAIARYNHPAGE